MIAWPRFTSVRARLYPSELSIEYVADAEDEGEKVALRVTLNVVQGLPETEVVYDLFADGNVGRGEGYGSGLPDLDSGTLELTAFPQLKRLTALTAITLRTMPYSPRGTVRNRIIGI